MQSSSERVDKKISQHNFHWTQQDVLPDKRVDFILRCKADLYQIISVIGNVPRNVIGFFFSMLSRF